MYQAFANSMIEGIGPTHGFFFMANIGYDYNTVLNTFSQDNQLFYPYYAPDTSGMWQYCHDFSTGVTEKNETTFIYSFQNPSTGNFTINFSQYLANGSIEIYNTIGEKVWYGNIYNQHAKEINLKNTSSGIYFLKVFDGEKVYCKKIIIE